MQRMGMDLIVYICITIRTLWWNFVFDTKHAKLRINGLYIPKMWFVKTAVNVSVKFYIRISCRLLCHLKVQVDPETSTDRLGFTTKLPFHSWHDNILHAASRILHTCLLPVCTTRPPNSLEAIVTTGSSKVPKCLIPFPDLLVQWICQIEVTFFVTKALHKITQTITFFSNLKSFLSNSIF